MTDYTPTIAPGKTGWDADVNTNFNALDTAITNLAATVAAIPTAGSGWTPVIGVETDGARRVLKVTDWTGGTGTKPVANQYLGSSGFVSTAAAAVDVRGAAGANGTTTTITSNNVFVGTTAPASPVVGQTVWVDTN